MLEATDFKRAPAALKAGISPWEAVIASADEPHHRPLRRGLCHRCQPDDRTAQLHLWFFLLTGVLKQDTERGAVSCNQPVGLFHPLQREAV